MGKSEKKTKSDRINALRKQYDAFLDEDKKRKDRNEFILGRLEKMRSYTPAVLPVHHSLASPQISKYHFVTQERSEYLRKIRFNDYPILCSRSTDVLPERVLKDEQTILQEISKKYILIPKLRPTNENSETYYPSNVSNDADWRNKYNILDELKKIEKEGSSEVSKDTDITYDTSNYRENNNLELKVAAPENIRQHELNSRDPIYNTQANDQKVPVTELQTNNNNTAVRNDSDYIDRKMPLETKQGVISTTVKSINFKNEVASPGLDSLNQEQRFSDSNTLNEEFYPNEDVVKVKLRNENKNVAKSNCNQAQDDQQNEMKVIDNVVPTNVDQISEIVKNKTVIQNKVELSNAKYVDSDIKVPLIEKENADLGLKTDEIVAQPAKNIENVEPCANIHQSELVSDNIEKQEYDSNNETVVSDNVISSQIDEFEAEQKGMFYSEETGYNQNVDTIGYNTQNEEYTNEQYSYYNEPQQEQPYYAEINEHEESTERYDPNYEQQYVENYQENVNDNYENQQYVGDNYENQQEVTNISYEQQPDQQEITNINYEQQPGEQDLTNYEQPVNYEYEHSGNLDNPDQSQIENIDTYDTQASEFVNYETQQYDGGEVEHPTIPEQSVYESQQDYEQMHTEQEARQNLEQLVGEEGYTETQNIYPSEHAAAVENISEIETNVKVT